MLLEMSFILELRRILNWFISLFNIPLDCFLLIINLSFLSIDRLRVFIGLSKDLYEKLLLNVLF